MAGFMRLGSTLQPAHLEPPCPGCVCRTLPHPSRGQRKVEVRVNKRGQPGGCVASPVPAARETCTDRGRRGREGGRADPRPERAWAPLGSGAGLTFAVLQRPSQASQTRARPSGLSGCALWTIFSQAGEKIACQLGRGWPATGEQVSMNANIDCCLWAQAGWLVAPTGSSPPASHRVPALPSLLRFLAQPAVQRRLAAVGNHTACPGVLLGDPGGPRAQAAAGLLPPPILGSRGCANLCLHLALLPRVGIYIR